MSDLSNPKFAKRDGLLVDFDSRRFYNAIWKAMVATAAREGREADPDEIGGLCQDLTQHVTQQLTLNNGHAPILLETIQDMVERALMEAGQHSVAKQYILYREDHTQRRTQSRNIRPEDVQAFLENRHYCATDLELFQT